MSRLYGRLEDINSVSKYLIDNYKKLYIPNYKEIEVEEVIETPKLIYPYLSEDTIKYIDDCDVKLHWNGKLPGTVYSGLGSDENVIMFRTRQMQEEYKIDLMYYLGDLLNRKNLDTMHGNHDTASQYSILLPLLIEYLFLKETEQTEVFSDRNLPDLRKEAKGFHRMYEIHKRFPFCYTEENILDRSLFSLIQLSSMDATLQIIDKYGNDKEELRRLIQELVDNIDSNREYIMNDRNISTYGFKRLRKEIDLRK